MDGRRKTHNMSSTSHLWNRKLPLQLQSIKKNWKQTIGFSPAHYRALTMFWLHNYHEPFLARPQRKSVEIYTLCRHVHRLKRLSWELKWEILHETLPTHYTFRQNRPTVDNYCKSFSPCTPISWNHSTNNVHIHITQLNLKFKTSPTHFGLIGQLNFNQIYLKCNWTTHI